MAARVTPHARARRPNTIRPLGDDDKDFPPRSCPFHERVIPYQSQEARVMEQKTAHDFDQELLILFDAYVHGAIDRRAFLDKAAKFAVGGVTAAVLLEQLSPNFAGAQQVRTDDTRINQEYIEFDSPNGYGKGRGY